ncbi:hypothetical protein [Pyrobaculum aerophilum]|uniref:hypothetical protein n=1 Tax=Pyrobaculum aerophilum TaxID=13773 RepID=UPI0015F28C1F|nr:hypothetical protein [Pyrobaculum aerophilum]
MVNSNIVVGAVMGLVVLVAVGVLITAGFGAALQGPAEDSIVSKVFAEVESGSRR